MSAAGSQGKQPVMVVAGGLAESLLNFRGPLLRALVERGWQVLAMAPDDGVSGARLQALGVQFVPVKLSRAGMNPLADLGTLWQFWRLFRRYRPQACLFYTIKPVIYGSLAARLAAVPRVVSMITGLGYAFTSGRAWMQKLAQGLYRAALRHNERVIFQNPDDQQLFIDLGLVRDAEQCQRIYGSGVDLQHFAPAPLPPQPVFLLVGRLLADKGVREFAAAARALKADFPQARFQLVGWIDSNPSAIRQQELDDWVGSGIIEYLGRLQDVRPALAQCSVYVLPSYREGTPRSVLEAMAMARPVVTTDAPGCRETVRDGINGFLVPVADAPALTAAMRRLLENPELRLQMGSAGLAMARELYDVHKVNAAIIATLEARP